MNNIKVTMKYSTLKKTDDGSYYASVRTENDQPMNVRLNNVRLTEGTLSGDDDVWFTYSGETSDNGLLLCEESIVADIKEDPSRWFGKNVREKTIDNSFSSNFSSNGEFQVTRSGNLKVFNKETKELWTEEVTSDDECDILVQVKGILFFKRNFQVMLKLHQVQLLPKAEEKKEEEEICHDDWVMEDYGFDE